VSDAGVFGRYLVQAGVIRFAIEFVRVNVRVAFGLTTAQLFSLGVVVAGAGFMVIASRGVRRA
jgi:phosphatidylglycerol:prolipoprotein diacylglycerol transferase